MAKITIESRFIGMSSAKLNPCLSLFFLTLFNNSSVSHKSYSIYSDKSFAVSHLQYPYSTDFYCTVMMETPALQLLHSLYKDRDERFRL
jgi:hypothetical protein